MKLEQIQPGLTDRAAFYGQTGSGKTTLAKFLLELRPTRILVFDWKGLIKWKGYHRFTNLKPLVNANKPKSIYAPSIKEIRDHDFWEAFFQYAYKLGNCQVYVDEVYSITDGDDIPDWYHACLTRGREKKVSVFSSSQRPVKIPQVILSEAEHTYTFRLQLKQDRQKVEQTTGLDAEKIIALPKHKFFHTTIDGNVTGPHNLKINGVKKENGTK
jgi:energy-coupling factor transporter ATP-binding protein EcfA2